MSVQEIADQADMIEAGINDGRAEGLAEGKAEGISEATIRFIKVSVKYNNVKKNRTAG